MPATATILAALLVSLVGLSITPTPAPPGAKARPPTTPIAAAVASIPQVAGWFTASAVRIHTRPEHDSPNVAIGQPGDQAVVICVREAPQTINPFLWALVMDTTRGVLDWVDNHYFTWNPDDAIHLPGCGWLFGP